MIKAIPTLASYERRTLISPQNIVSIFIYFCIRVPKLNALLCCFIASLPIVVANCAARMIKSQMFRQIMGTVQHRCVAKKAEMHTML